MNKYSFKSKIYFIFAIPVIAILFFAYISINNEYLKLQDAHLVNKSSQITKTLIKLIQNIQIERGLSAGYIVIKNKKLYKKNLLQHYKKTNIIYDIFLNIISNSQINSDTKVVKIIDKVKDKFNKITLIREKVLNSNITFKDEIKYYSDINKNIIFLIKLINKININYNIEIDALIQIESIKELAGLQRANIYYQLFGGLKPSLQAELHILDVRKQDIIDELLLTASKESKNIYKRNLSDEIIKELEACKKGLLNRMLTSQDATRCFDINTKYIKTLNNSSTQIVLNYLRESQTVEQDAIKYLSIIVMIWLISIIALSIILYILIVSIKKEELNINKLRIASYAFDAQEAMVITDENAEIIEVNKAFTEITGYSAEEAIGNKTSILKSNKHDKFFFKEMWDAIIKNGKWHGEIYNKRKNGEIYPERLSITAIKDEKGHTLNYIAQFLDITDIKKAQKEAEFQASHDFLTGVLNRRHLLQRLHEEFHKATRHNFVHAFLFIDLDHFKAVNDNFGHNIGDLLIIEVTNRLKNVLREGDVLARISGDEFGIITLNLEKNNEIKAVDIICNKILELISTEFVLQGNKINISSSIGVKLFPNKEKNVQDIITHADTAMYMAKHDGKNRYILYKH